MPRIKKVPTPPPVEAVRMRTNTVKRTYHIAITCDGKTVDTFAATTDTVVNALKSAYEQCCGYTFTPREELPEPPKEVINASVEASARRGRRSRNE